MTPGALLSPGNLVQRLRPKIAAGTGRALARIGRAGALASSTAEPLGRLGDLEVRLAATTAEIRQAQALRYHVFYEEMSAVADFRARQTRRDVDRFDKLCDHLLVVDHAASDASSAEPQIVATYRLLRHDVAERRGGFYSQGEFDIAPLIARNPELRFLELGRSCVLAPYRNRRALELLWHGIWAYVRLHGADVMIGCASLEGTDLERLALPLSFLHHHASATGRWRVLAHPSRRVAMDQVAPSAIDARAALRTLPPLVKGYLRLGAMVGDGAVVDRQFGTTDVLMVLPVAGIASRYIAHYGEDATRYAIRPGSAGHPLAAA